MAALLAATVISLRRRDTTATLRLLTGRAKPWPDFSPPHGLRALRRAARFFRANCLAQSVALTIALESAQTRPTLVLGCRRYQDKSWGAHAWVLVGTEVLDALPSGAHTPLAQLTAESLWVPAPIAPGIR